MIIRLFTVNFKGGSVKLPLKSGRGLIIIRTKIIAIFTYSCPYKSWICYKRDPWCLRWYTPTWPHIVMYACILVLGYTGKKIYRKDLVYGSCIPEGTLFVFSMWQPTENRAKLSSPRYFHNMPIPLTAGGILSLWCFSPVSFWWKITLDDVL